MMLDSKISSYHQEITLLDNSRIILRPICSEDKNALVAFHSRLSEDSRFLRYQYLKGELTEGDLKNFCEIDYDNTLALVAEKAQSDCQEIIGVGRYYRLPNPYYAEVAFVVQDSEQKKSIGTQLLKHLAILASKKDIRFFVAEILKINGKMISILRKSDSNMEYVNGDSCSTCTITISVAEAAQRIL